VQDRLYFATALGRSAMDESRAEQPRTA